MKKFKRLFIITFTSIIVIICLIIMFNIIIDPYRFYRYSEQQVFDDRLENPGIIKNYDYNAIIFGSSMSHNNSPKQVDSLFGWNTINVSLSGLCDNDLIYNLQLIERIGKCKNVIMDINYFSFFTKSTDLELYLYDNNCFNDIEYLLSYVTIENSIKKMKESNVVKREDMRHFSRAWGKDKLFDNYISRPKILYNNDSVELEIKERFDMFCNQCLQDSKLNFYIYFPPYSILYFIEKENIGLWKVLSNFKYYMNEKLLSYKNVKLFDFQNENFILNSDDYMDISHYAPYVNKRIIDCIAKDSFRMTKDNYNREIEKLDSLVRNYDIEEIINKNK